MSPGRTWKSPPPPGSGAAMPCAEEAWPSIRYSFLRSWAELADRLRSLLADDTPAIRPSAESFKTAMNTRLEYYRQLQAVSDAVLPYEGAKTDEATAKMTQTEEDIRRKLSSAEAKHRYREWLSSSFTACIHW